jgi:hypothetical protein
VSEKPGEPRFTTHVVLRLSDESARRLKDRLAETDRRLANDLGKPRTPKEVRALLLEYRAEREAIHRRFMSELRDEAAADALHAFDLELREDLAACLPDPEPGRPKRPNFGRWFDHLAHCLRRLERQNWTAADIAYWRRVDRDVREEQHKLEAAIEALGDRLKKPGSSEETWQLIEAIGALMAVKPSLPWGNLFVPRGRPPKPPALTARIIGGLTLEVLRSADQSAGHEPRTKLVGAAVDFIMRWLDRCLESDELPEREEILRIVSKLHSR